MMNLTEFKNINYPKLIQFNTEQFPDRKGVEESFEDRFFKNPYRKDGLEKSAFIADENSDIHGQFLIMPNQFYYKKKEFNGFWGFDFILNENLRGKGMGKILSQETMKFPNYCVLGVSKASEALHFKNGNKELALAERYIRFISILSPLRLVLKKNNFDRYQTKYPQNLHKNKIAVERITNKEELPNQPFWDENALEWDRGKDFLQWRFFSKDNQYAFYFSTKKDFYLVVRKVRWKNLNVLLLVDYRYQNDKIFDEIYQFAIQIAKKNSCSAIITVTSLELEKQKLKRKLNIKFGEPMQVMTTCKDVFECKNVKTTFADSDVDTFYGDNVW